MTLGPLDTVTIGGVPVSTPLRTALDVALHAPEPDAVSVLRALAGAKGLGCQLDIIRQAIEARPRLPGKARALQRIGAAMERGAVAVPGHPARRTQLRSPRSRAPGSSTAHGIGAASAATQRRCDPEVR